MRTSHNVRIEGVKHMSYAVTGVYIGQVQTSTDMRRRCRCRAAHHLSGFNSGERYMARWGSYSKVYGNASAVLDVDPTWKYPMGSFCLNIYPSPPFTCFVAAIAPSHPSSTFFEHVSFLDETHCPYVMGPPSRACTEWARPPLCSPLSCDQILNDGIF